MAEANLSNAQQIAHAAKAFEHESTGGLPSSITVVLSEDKVVITLCGTLSPAETALAKSWEGADRLREFRRQLFTIASEPLRQEVTRITGIEVREKTAEVVTSTGTVVQVFWLTNTVPPETWSGNYPGPAAQQ